MNRRLRASFAHQELTLISLLKRMFQPVRWHHASPLLYAAAATSNESTASQCHQRKSLRHVQQHRTTITSSANIIGCASKQVKSQD
eukprot:6480837-Amphidinium_carterae.3